ncbi:MAG TPA: DUF58 domain-containing protein [Tepidisphaeraceae bacterium]|nr:DUF58 domain-containing protein [Tepidisphaeraceae bacterium]
MSFVTRYLEPALVERLNHLQLSARSVVEGSITGQHRSPVKGASVEFRQHRFYTPGDDPRRLDWRVLGRTDRPYIKEYDEETNLRCMLMLDCSGSMSYGAARPGRDGQDANSKFDYGARVIASLAYLMLGQTESVGLAMCGASVEQWIAPRAGTAQLARIIDALERGTPRGEAKLGQAMQQVADRLDKRSLVVAVTDAFLPAQVLRAGLARLRHDRHETILFQVLDGAEVEFPFRTWSRFRGMEGEPAQLCEPALVRKVYLENFRRHSQDLHDICRMLGVEFYSFVTEKPLIDTITAFLQRRNAAI